MEFEGEYSRGYKNGIGKNYNKDGKKYLKDIM